MHACLCLPTDDQGGGESGYTEHTFLRRKRSYFAALGRNDCLAGGEDHQSSNVHLRACGSCRCDLHVAHLRMLPGANDGMRCDGHGRYVTSALVIERAYKQPFTLDCLKVMSPTAHGNESPRNPAPLVQNPVSLQGFASGITNLSGLTKGFGEEVSVAAAWSHFLAEDLFIVS